MTNTTNAVLRLVAVTMLCGGMAAPMTAVAQDKPYAEGTVWAVTFIRVKPGMFDVYMRDLLPQRKKIDEEAKKQGLVISSHILTGNSMGHDDWDVMILDEYKNWAALDGLSAKYAEYVKLKALNPHHQIVVWAGPGLERAYAATRAE